jgi:hypothetical protein
VVTGAAKHNIIICFVQRESVLLLATDFVGIIPSLQVESKVASIESSFFTVKALIFLFIYLKDTIFEVNKKISFVESRNFNHLITITITSTSTITSKLISGHRATFWFLEHQRQLPKIFNACYGFVAGH